VDGAATETIIEQGPAWIEALATLTPTVAIALLLVAVVVLYVHNQRNTQKSVLETIETISKTIVTPLAESQKMAMEEFKGVVTNHLAHDAEDRRANTEALVGLVAYIKDREGGKQ
jgi:hypothetical protein